MTSIEKRQQNLSEKLIKAGEYGGIIAGALGLLAGNVTFALWGAIVAAGSYILDIKRK